MENIDNVLLQLVLAGCTKIDWEPGKTRSCPDGSWSISTDPDCSYLKDLEEIVTKRMQVLSIDVNVNVGLQVFFDPVSRRVEAFEVYETEFGGMLLTMMFWPGLASARELCNSTLNQWQQAIENGWFEGI